MSARLAGVRGSTRTWDWRLHGCRRLGTIRGLISFGCSAPPVRGLRQVLLNRTSWPVARRPPRWAAQAVKSWASLSPSRAQACFHGCRRLGTIRGLISFGFGCSAPPVRVGPWFGWGPNKREQQLWIAARSHGQPATLIMHQPNCYSLQWSNFFRSWLGCAQVCCVLLGSDYESSEQNFVGLFLNLERC
jgi:hypothetical protein